ncbi:MAG: peptidoglycan-binding protein [Pseudomonadota bacterium]
MLFCACVAVATALGGFTKSAEARGGKRAVGIAIGIVGAAIVLDRLSRRKRARRNARGKQRRSRAQRRARQRAQRRRAERNRAARARRNARRSAPRFSERSPVHGRPRRVAAPAAGGSFQRTAEIQSALNANGFDAGAVDGRSGPGTRRAIRAFQRSIGERQTGRLSEDQFARLTQPAAGPGPGAPPPSTVAVRPDLGQPGVAQPGTAQPGSVSGGDVRIGERVRPAASLGRNPEQRPRVFVPPTPVLSKDGSFRLYRGAALTQGANGRLGSTEDGVKKTVSECLSLCTRISGCTTFASLKSGKCVLFGGNFSSTESLTRKRGATVGHRVTENLEQAQAQPQQ